MPRSTWRPSKAWAVSPARPSFCATWFARLADSPVPPVATCGRRAGRGQAGLHDVQLPAACEAPVKKLIDEFSAQEVRSKPIGFYTWTESLSDIFRQDRMFQTELDSPAGVEALAKALAADPKDRAAYAAYLTLVSRLTNRLAYPDLRGCWSRSIAAARSTCPTRIRFFPPSQSHETELVKRLFGNRPIPEGFNLIDEMVRRIRAHELSLKPGPDSGWYDYQTWALEPLVVPGETPEARHLRYDATYVRLLEELFKGILALTRETHIKQLEVPMVGAAARDPARRSRSRLSRTDRRAVGQLLLPPRRELCLRPRGAGRILRPRGRWRRSIASAPT